MRELRRDPVIDRWVIISAERAARPMPVYLEHVAQEDSFCPFCQGNEASTPPEVFAVRNPDSAPDGPGWSLRVVPNKFPALGREGDLNSSRNGIYESMNGFGIHEVIIETPDHGAGMADASPGCVEELFRTVAGQMNEFRNDKRIRCVQFFKNHGHAAGASLPHPHSQLIAMPVISKSLSEELTGSESYLKRKGGCVYCDIIDHEFSERTRTVTQNEHFAVMAPYASRFAYETWILPKKHRHRFERIGEEEIASLSDILIKTLGAVNAALDSPPYNLILHTAPFEPGHGAHFHWRLELIPFTVRVAGFEWGAGFHINPSPPETAAERLRELI